MLATEQFRKSTANFIEHPIRTDIVRCMSCTLIRLRSAFLSAIAERDFSDLIKERATILLSVATPNVIAVSLSGEHKTDCLSGATHRATGTFVHLYSSDTYI